MPKLYLLIATLFGLALLSACGGGSNEPHHCYETPFSNDCDGNPLAQAERELQCLRDPGSSGICGAVISNYCLTTDPLNPNCTADERFNGCLANPIRGCLNAGEPVANHCSAYPFDSRPACRGSQFESLRVAACQNSINADPSCRQVLAVNVSNAGFAQLQSSYTSADSVTETRVNGIDVYTRGSGLVRIPADTTLTARSLAAIRTTESGNDETRPISYTLRRAGDAQDGVTVFAASAAADTRHSFAVAGLSASTDVGTALTTTTGTATWPGQFILYSNIAAQSLTQNGGVDIDFVIDFAASPATITASAPTGRAGTTFSLTGTTFNGRGLISGGFTVASTSDAITAGYPALASVSTGNNNIVWTSQVLGLIGSQGLVGLLHGTLDDKNDNADARVYAGGFVADRDRVFYDVWRDAVRPVASPDAARGNQFVQDPSDDGGGTAVLLDFSTAQYGAGNQRAALVADSVTDKPRGGVGGYLLADGSARYAGALAEVDLGVRLNHNRFNGIWRGALALTRGAVGKTFTTDIGLAVDFGTGSAGGGTVSAFVKVEDTTQSAHDRYLDNTHLLIDGAFNSEGLITGTTVLDEFPHRGHNINIGDGEASAGLLRGLIGARGAVAAILSNAAGASDSGYAGGLVAVPTGGRLPAANYNAWVREASPSDAPDSLPAPAFGGGDVQSKFLKNSNGVFSTSGLNNGVSGTTTLTLAAGNLGGDSNDGVVFFIGDHNLGRNPSYFGSVLSGTSLGAPLPEYVANVDLPATAEWKGRVQTVGRAAGGFVHSTTALEETGFTLEVNYEHRLIEAFIPVEGNIAFHIQGRYDSNGVISARSSEYAALFGRFDGNRTIQSATRAGGVGRSDISGLIGQDGAVGVFRSRSGGSGFAGGFVAVPPK